MKVTRRSVLGGMAAAPLTLGPWAAGATGATGADLPVVDLALLMLVDSSASIAKEKLDFQLRGHAAAFRHPATIAAARSGPAGRICVKLAQFAGPDTLVGLAPWTVLAGPDDCRAFADAVDRAPGIAMGGPTALGAAVVDGVRLLDQAPVRAMARKIDIVSNGFSNAGLDPRSAGAHAAAAGVTVNALAILDEYDWLEEYFARTVVAGPGAFVQTAESPASFAEAFLRKLVTEIA